MQQLNIISFFLFFLQSYPSKMSCTYLDYLKYRYKSNKFSKIRLILSNFRKSGHLWLADNFFFAPTGSANWRKNCSIYSSLISCETNVSTWHMYWTGWDLIFLFTFILSFENGISKKSSPISQMFYRIVGVLRGVVKISQVSLENTCAG